MPAQINRDPFARATLYRDRAVRGVECAWCGQPARFVYYWEPDDRASRLVDVGCLRSFCSVGCYRTYR